MSSAYSLENQDHDGWVEDIGEPDAFFREGSTHFVAFSSVQPAENADFGGMLESCSSEVIYQRLSHSAEPNRSRWTQVTSEGQNNSENNGKMKRRPLSKSKLPDERRCRSPKWNNSQVGRVVYSRIK